MWLFKGRRITQHSDLFPICTDFVYQIEYTDGRKYIGKKTVRSIRRKKPTKVQLAKRKNYARKEWVNLPFVNYEGSHGKELGLDIKTKEILYQCSTKKAATYLEAALLFYNDAIFDPIYLNENITGKFFNTDLNGFIDYNGTSPELPINYNDLNQSERREVRMYYIAMQKGKCYYCKGNLNDPPTDKIKALKIDLSLFPNNFLKYPIHLHHDHTTGMIIGAVHAYCNAILWQYEGE